MHKPLLNLWRLLISSILLLSWAQATCDLAPKLGASTRGLPGTHPITNGLLPALQAERAPVDNPHQAVEKTCEPIEVVVPIAPQPTHTASPTAPSHPNRKPKLKKRRKDKPGFFQRLENRTRLHRLVWLGSLLIVAGAGGFVLATFLFSKVSSGGAALGLLRFVLYLALPLAAILGVVLIIAAIADQIQRRPKKC